jgi:hypothetical protein
MFKSIALTQLYFLEFFPSKLYYVIIYFRLNLSKYDYEIRLTTKGKSPLSSVVTITSVSILIVM